MKKACMLLMAVMLAACGQSAPTDTVESLVASTTHSGWAA